MKINEIFYSIQGEIDIGKPSIFIRFSGCNLIQDNKACEFCDTLYAEKGSEKSLDEVINEIIKYNCKNIVITGGEPLNHKEDLERLIYKLIELKYNISVETNGTIFNEVLWEVDSINCSPKKQQINIEVLKKLCQYNTRFKFVYEDKNDLWWESILNELNIENKDIYIMPEGKTKEKQIEKTEEVINYCKEKEYNFTPRLHVLIWEGAIGK